ncbi:MAG: hypothetical protein AB8G22_09100 [Saprospiraceae bacterium]
MQSGVENGELAADKDVAALSSLLFTLYNGIKVIAKVEPDREKLLASIQPVLSLLD